MGQRITINGADTDDQDVRHELPAEERYRLLVDAIVDYAVYMLDVDGTVASWNPGAQRFKGYTAEEIIGSHFSVQLVCPPKD